MTELAALADANKELATTNGTLVQKLIDHETLVREHDDLQRRFRFRDREARDALAEKSALQQEMRLASAQKAARRADTLIVAIPLTFALIMNNTFLLIAILFYCRVFPPGYAWTAIPISCIGTGTGILAARPTNTVSVRSMAVFTIPADCIPVLVLNCGFMVFAAIYEPWRPAARPVAYTWAAGIVGLFVCLVVCVLTVLRGAAGSAAALTQRQRFLVTLRYMQQKYGDITAIVLLLGSFGIYYGMYAGVACSKVCTFPMAPRLVVQRAPAES